MTIITRIWTGFGLLLMLFLISTIANLWLGNAISSNSTYLNTSEVIIRQSNGLLKNVLDKETGFRGFLLTGEEEFLDPYTAGKEQYMVSYRDLQRILSSEGRHSQKLENINRLASKWDSAFAQPLITKKRDVIETKGDPIKADSAMVLILRQSIGRKIVDSIRIEFANLISEEYKIRAVRGAKLNNSSNLITIFNLSLLLAGVSIGIFTIGRITKQVKSRITNLVHHSERIARGDFTSFKEKQKPDELTRLSLAMNQSAMALDDNIGDLRKKNEELDQFAFIVSHDLKAPLRGISNVLTWIDEDLSDKLEPEVHQHLDMIKSRVGRMDNLINGILALSRVGRTTPPRERVNVADLLDEIIDLLATPTSFAFVYDKKTMPTLFTEKVYLQQVFSNLLSNALKYHPEPDYGRVEIKVKDLGSTYSFSVADNGPGIDEAFHTKVFGVFQTLEARDKIESTGIGLSIVKKIIEHKGGSVVIDSSLGKGATFTFTWPKTERTNDNLG